MDIKYEHKRRGYLHFDSPLSGKQAAKLVSCSDAVSSHGFYPFLRYDIKVRRIKREKKNGIIRISKSVKPRRIMYAAHRDAAIFGYYSQLLSNKYEESLVNLELSNCVRAFRQNLGTNIDAAKEVFDFMKNQPCYAIAMDVSEFFDNLDHDYLKQRWEDVLGVNKLPYDHFKVFTAITKYSEVSRDVVYELLKVSKHSNKKKSDSESKRVSRLCSGKEFRAGVDILKECGLLKSNTEFGIPQGSPISAVLSNVYMLRFDEAMQQYVGQRGGLYRRYCDDIMVVLPTSVGYEDAEEYARELVDELKLEINPKKTKRARFPYAEEDGVDPYMQYLGFVFDGNEVELRAGSMNKYYSKMRGGVLLAKKTKRKHDRMTGQNSPLRTRKIYRQYSYLISRRGYSSRYSEEGRVANFLTYAYKAARKFNSPRIRRQVKGHWKQLQKELQKPL